MTNGTVLMHNGCTGNWYKLTPDNTGSYINGTWSSVPKMPNGYAPLYFSSQVLPDGKLIVNGGEYQNCNGEWTTQGAIYDPVANKWKDVPPPTGWNSIGDAQSVVRQDGVYMLADALTTKQALATINGMDVTWTTTGAGKADRNDEEGWTALPDNTILTVDANRDLGGSANDVEFYSPTTGTWTTASEKTPVAVVDAGSHELGPAPLLPNGLVFQIGATVHNAIYDHSDRSLDRGAGHSRSGQRGPRFRRRPGSGPAERQHPRAGEPWRVRARPVAFLRDSGEVAPPR